MDTKPVVLYVEDDPQSRRVVQILLTTRMHLDNVIVFENSRNFIERVEALSPKPDIIFLDIHVQPTNGFNMLKMLRELEWTRHVPIVALTASVMNEEVQELRTVGFSGCLAKPIDLKTFPDTFERLLDGEAIWRIYG